ncbi:MAG: hypothetical protein IT355_08450 [Gemmatimonadaceae bacterium]|nr:hypothetical protein [Gemmatimonadaceae bacterium]
MSPLVTPPQLVLRNVRKVITAGVGSCRVRVTVLGGVSLQLMPGDALAITGALPLARSMLCAIAAGVARADSGSARWGPRGLAGVRYAPAGDAPRALQRRDGLPAGLVILDAALTERAPAPDVRVLVALLRPWLACGGAALVAAPLASGDAWPWPMLELAGGQLRPVLTPLPAEAPGHAMWSAPARMVAEGRADRMARGAPDR